MRVVVSTVAALLLVLLLVGGAQLWQLQQRLSDPTAAGMFASGAGGGGFHEARVELLQAAVQEMLLGALGGYGLLLGLVIGQLAGSIREGEVAALSIATLKKQAQGLQDEYMRLANERSGERGVEEEAVKKARGLKDSIARLEKDIRHKEEEVETWQGRTRAAETNVAAIRKQTEGLQLEYDRLLDENESLRAQLAVFDRKFASKSKKDL
ncbi:unnamed protein product [Closterium sp. NIES-64]|nr:unnamed protein product [Closterium sp. NIES-64]